LQTVSCAARKRLSELASDPRTVVHAAGAKRRPWRSKEEEKTGLVSGPAAR